MTTHADSSSIPTVPRHSALEDIVGLLVGSLLVSFGLFLLKSGGAVTGGTAGLALLLSYAMPVSFGLLFVAVNLPFFLLAIRGKGWNFVLRSGASILLVALMSMAHPLWISLDGLPTLPAALAGNVLCGVGLLITFRHQSSLGGFTILALLAQDRFGFRAGYVLMVLDTIVVLSSLVVVSPLNVAISALGAFALNLILALNHRPGRYAVV